jgi:hypothetical protein
MRNTSGGVSGERRPISDKPEADSPKEMERVDPGWSDFTQRVEADNEQREFLQNELATQDQELVLRQSVQAYELAEDDSDVVRAALYAGSGGGLRAVPRDG